MVVVPSPPCSTTSFSPAKKIKPAYLPIPERLPASDVTQTQCIYLKKPNKHQQIKTLNTNLKLIELSSFSIKLDGANRG